MTKVKLFAKEKSVLELHNDSAMSSDVGDQFARRNKSSLFLKLRFEDYGALPQPRERKANPLRLLAQIRNRAQTTAE